MGERVHPAGRKTGIRSYKIWISGDVIYSRVYWRVGLGSGRFGRCDVGTVQSVKSGECSAYTKFTGSGDKCRPPLRERGVEKSNHVKI